MVNAYHRKQNQRYHRPPILHSAFCTLHSALAVFRFSFCILYFALVVSRSALCTLHSAFSTRRARGTRAAAMIETAILLPLYMIILFGLLYFGYATLSKQAQTSAAQYAAWCPQTQSAKTMLERFWPWAGTANLLGSGSGTSQAEATDMNLLIYENMPTGDPYYGENIQTQLVDGIGSLTGGRSGDVFHLERLTVDLWTCALGEVHQRPELIPVGGEDWEIRIHTTIEHDDIATFLNPLAHENEITLAFITAGENNPPVVSDREPRIADAINGPGEHHWLERRLVTVDSTYRPPFFKNIYSEQDAPPTDYATYISLQYKEPADKELTKAEIRFDVTGRGSGQRNAAGENGETSGNVLAATADLLGGGELSPADKMNGDSIGVFGKVEDAWERKIDD